MLKTNNLHYLQMYPKIEESFKKALDRAEEGEVQEAFFNLRYCLEGLETELIKNNEWYKARVEVKDKPSSEEIIKRLKFENTITDTQMDLFNAIRRFGNRNVHYGEDSKSEQKELETLKNFCVRLDNELPSIMAHLGIGGATRKEFVDENNKAKEIGSKKSIDETLKATFKNTSSSSGGFKSTSSATASQRTSYTGTTVRDKTPSFNYSSYTAPKSKLPFNQRFNKFYDSTPVFLVRFVVVLIVAIILLNFVFFNKLTSSDLESFYNTAYTAETEFFEESFKKIPESLGNMFSDIGEGFGNLVEFLKFE